MPLTPWLAAAALAPLTPSHHFSTGAFASARVGFQALARRSPLTVTGRECQLLTLLRLDAWSEALLLGERVRQESPELAGLYALACLRGGQPHRAQELAEAAWHEAPEAFWPLVALGTIALRWESDLRAAQGYLRQATALRPSSPEAWLALLAAVQDPREAEQVEQELARCRPLGYPFQFWSAPLRQRAHTAASFSAAFPGGETFCWPKTKPSDVIVLALKRDPRGMLYIEAELDGHSLRLLYDTAAGRHFIVTPQALARLKPLFVASTVITGLQGQSHGTIHRAERLRLGALELGAVPVESTAANLGGFDGLIGWRVFGERVQQLDLQAGTLTLRERPLPQDRRGVVVPMQLVQDQPVLWLQAGGTGKRGKIPFLSVLDTGAPQDIFSLRAGARLVPRPGRGQLLQETLGIGQTHAKIEFRTLRSGFGLFTLQGQHLTDYTQATAASFLDRVYSPAVGIEHDLLLGMDFLSRFSQLTLDPVGKTATLVPPLNLSFR